MILTKEQQELKAKTEAILRERLEKAGLIPKRKPTLETAMKKTKE